MFRLAPDFKRTFEESITAFNSFDAEALIKAKYSGCQVVRTLVEQMEKSPSRRERIPEVNRTPSEPSSDASDGKPTSVLLMVLSAIGRGLLGALRKD